VISIIKRRRTTAGEPQVGNIVHFSDIRNSAVASCHYRAWQLLRFFEGEDGRRYVRLVAMADRTVTKLLLVDTLLKEHFTVEQGEFQEIIDIPGQLSVREPVLQLKSSRALAAIQQRSAFAAD
jgi:hypothetical protein